jgi:hypothetical protein
MSSLPETLLALIVGRARAAATVGDLTEMAATRGRLWFAAAYARIRFSLTWRIVLALFAAALCREFVFDAFHVYLRYAPTAWRTGSGPYLTLLSSSGPLLAMVMSTLWFALPYAIVLYGLRDRFVRLTSAFCVGVTIAFLFIPGASLLFAASTLLLAAGVLISRRWRKPFEVLAGTTAVSLLTFAAAGGLRSVLHPQPGIERILVNYVEILAFQATLLVIAITCSSLHRRLLDEPPSGSTLAS